MSYPYVAFCRRPWHGSCSFFDQALSLIKGTYNIKVSDIQTDDVLFEQRIVAQIGYYAHIVSLVWSGDNRTVTATIDHDFGEDKRVAELNIDHIAVLNEKNK